MERSETPRCDALLSLKLPKSLKREAQKKAEAKGVTLSEVVRRQLQELGSEKATA